MRSLFFTALVLLAAVTSAAGKEPKPGKNLLANASFERTAPGTVPKDAGQGPWRLAGDGTLPSGWTLNVSYPGVLTVLTEDAAEGARCIQVAAGAKRDAQLFRPCPAMQAGTWYRISMRVRGGTATLLTYEYAAGGAPKAYTLASATASDGAWRTVTGFYTPRDAKYRSASVALLVPKGLTAAIDDVRVEAMDGPTADAKARAIKLANESAELRISGAGNLESVTLRGSQENLVDTAFLAPVLTALHDGVRMPVATLTKRGSTWVARFPDAAVSVKLRVKPAKHYVLFEVLDAKPKGLEGVALRFPLKPRKTRDTWMPGTYDNEVGVTHMGVTPNTQVELARFGRAVVPEARWWRRQGIRGGRSALIVTARKRFLPTIRQMELDTGLPSPVLRSSYAEATGTSDWVRVSPALDKSYLFATYLGFGDIDQLIQYAKLGGFGLIMLHRTSWRASGGHEAIARTAFPEGLSTLVAVCGRIHAAGLGVGLHLYGPAVSTNDAYVTPVPDKRLFAYDVGKLGVAAKADATELVFKEAPRLPRVGAPDIHPGNLLRIGNEIIRWKRSAPGTPERLIGCERGVFGTKARAHGKGSAVRTLVLRNGGLLVDPDSTLPDEMGEHLARVVNTCGIDLVYFDALASAAPSHQPEAWYYLNRVLLASCAKFDHGVIVQTGMGPGRQLAWHLVARSASADGHGDLKGYLDRRMAGIRQMRRTHTAADIGWYALDIHGRPDELEYVCAKALGVGASISVQAHKPLLESHPRAREVFDMIARWERRRLAGDVSPEMRAYMAAQGREIRLLEDDEGAWSFWEAAYDTERAVAKMDGKANVWKLTNDHKAPVALAVEIERAPIAATPAEHAASSLPIHDLGDAAGFAVREDPALERLIMIGARSDQADGFSRRGVKTTLSQAQDPAVGGAMLRMRAANSIRGAGWGSAGTTLAQPVDLSTAKSLGLWVHGDGIGASLSVTLADEAGERARFTVTLDYKGWRFQSFPRRGPEAFAWDTVAHVLLELNHIPPETTVTAGVASLRGIPSLHAPRAMPGITIKVGRREVDLFVPFEAGRVITIDGLGRGVYWPGGMQEGSVTDIAGGPLMLPVGTHEVGVSLKDPAGYAGDLRVRFGRMRRLGR